VCYPTSEGLITSTILAIYNSPTLSLTALNLPLTKIFSTEDSLLLSGLTPRTVELCGPFLLTYIVLLVFSSFHYFFQVLVSHGTINWLLASFWARVSDATI